MGLVNTCSMKIYILLHLNIKMTSKLLSNFVQGYEAQASSSMKFDNNHEFVGNTANCQRLFAKFK